MTLYIDCTTFSKWTGHHTGIQRVIHEIGIRLQSSKLEAQPIFWEDENICYEFDLVNNCKAEQIDLKGNSIIFAAGSDWDNSAHHDLLINYSKRGIIVPLFYDIIPIILPHSFGPGFSTIYKNWLDKTLKISAMAFSISDNTKRDLYQYTRTLNSYCPDIYSIRLGDEINKKNNQQPSDNVRREALEPFILTVGTIELRKNHIFLLNLYRYMIEYLSYIPPKLIIVGKQGWADQNIGNQIENDILLKDKIKILHSIPDIDLSFLYENCLFTLFPSIYEGWGLPVAESLKYKKPCISSNTSSMPEISNDHIKFLDPMDTTGWAQAIIEMNNKETLNKITKKIEENHRATSWNESAESIMNILKDRFPKAIKF